MSTRGRRSGCRGNRFVASKSVSVAVSCSVAVPTAEPSNEACTPTLGEVALQFELGLQGVVCQPGLGEGDAVLAVDVFALEVAGWLCWRCRQAKHRQLSQVLSCVNCGVKQGAGRALGPSRAPSSVLNALPFADFSIAPRHTHTHTLTRG